MARRLVAAGHQVTTWPRGTGVAVADAVDGTPLGAVAERLRVPAAETRYALAHAAKDLELAAWPEARLATAARSQLQEARAAALGDRDLTAVAEFLRAPHASAGGRRAVPVTSPERPRPARPWRCRSCSHRGCCWRWTWSSRCSHLSQHPFDEPRRS
ncbi:hypothetical protein [Nonomuraea maritima]|uniref:hypothetical protein n=1 Tax=Nonomuraea maritima TaxID=683260 RepID=UPI00115FCF15|nr:hypothetical protein [Nonomuraea maritima]